MNKFQIKTGLVLRGFLLCCMSVVYVLATGLEVKAQMRQDPRSIGMAGAYTTTARDIYAVGVNPANLAIVKSYASVQLFLLNLGVSNTSITLNEYNKFNGANLELGGKKEELLTLIPDEGLSLFFDGAVKTPLINFSLNNMAITTDIYSTGEITIPKTPFEFMLNGNEVGREYSLNADGEAMVVGELGFSNGGVFRNYLTGFTVRAVRGFAYYEVINTNGTIMTDSSFVTGAGEYIVLSSSGGIGYSIDLGFLAVNVYGWQIGASLNNLLGHIRWTGDTKKIRYFYTIDNFNVNRMMTKGYTSLVVGNNEELEAESFTISYPRVLRIGASRRLPLTLLAVDLQKGFSDRFFASKKSRLAVGVEFYGIPFMPLRGGLAIGGDDEKELAFGLGINAGIISFDLGAAFRGSLYPGDAKGLNISLGLALRRPY